MCGCQGKEPLDFSGENKNWSANVNVNTSKNDKETALIKLNYLGNQVESIGDFGIRRKRELTLEELRHFLAIEPTKYKQYGPK